MSTTDSCLLGTSCVVVNDYVVRFNLWPSATPQNLVFLGKCLDVGVTALGLFMATVVDRSGGGWG